MFLTNKAAYQFHCKRRIVCVPVWQAQLCCSAVYGVSYAINKLLPCDFTIGNYKGSSFCSFYFSSVNNCRDKVVYIDQWQQIIPTPNKNHTSFLYLISNFWKESIVTRSIDPGRTDHYCLNFIFFM